MRACWPPQGAGGRAGETGPPASSATRPRDLHRRVQPRPCSLPKQGDPLEGALEQLAVSVGGDLPDSLRRCGPRREKEDQDQEGQQEPQRPAIGGAGCHHGLVAPSGMRSGGIFPEKRGHGGKNMLLLLPALAVVMFARSCRIRSAFMSSRWTSVNCLVQAFAPLSELPVEGLELSTVLDLLGIPQRARRRAAGHRLGGSGPPGTC